MTPLQGQLLTDAPTHLIVGPDGHGVTRYALELADALSAARIIREAQFTAAPLPDSVEFVHVAFTDHLFAPRPGAFPDEAVDALLQRVGTRRLSVSFHDIPQPEEGTERFAWRATAYRRLATAAHHSGGAAVVNSEHEAAFFRSNDSNDSTEPAVIRLPIPVIESHYDPEPGTVGILGFLYPGKGHSELVAALAGTGYRLRFLGSVSKGHDDWAADLLRTADASGIDAEITGWLSDDALAREMGRIQIPVCAHRHFSASGSLMTWLGAGRHVLATDSDYTREIDTWLPGRITRVANYPGAWRDAIDAFAAAPPAVAGAPEWGWGDVAKQWRAVWEARA